MRTKCERGELLRIDGLTLYYRGDAEKKRALNQIGFSLRGGECLAMIGESGSGKTTIAKVLQGILPPSSYIESGTMELLEASCDLTNYKSVMRHLRGGIVTSIFQDAKLSLNPGQKIRSQLLENIRAEGQEKERILCSAVGVMKSLGLIDAGEILEAYPRELSGGMCQRIEIAMAISMKARIMITDEPTSALDQAAQQETISMLKKVKAEYGTAILFITHDIGLVSEIADQILILKDGEIVEIGDCGTIFKNAAHPYTRKLLDADRYGMRERKTKKRRNIILKGRELRKSFGGKEIVRGIDLEIGEGESVGLYGKSGCGKSTLARCLAGLIACEQGEVRLNNQCLTGTRPRELQMIFQDARDSLNPVFKAVSLVAEPLHALKIGARAERAARARHFLALVGLTEEEMERRPTQLSTGQCQRVAIARALAIGPDLLICDEIVSALDKVIQKQIMELIFSLQRDFDFALLFISHDERLLRAYCDRILKMDEGLLSQTN